MPGPRLPPQPPRDPQPVRRRAPPRPPATHRGGSAVPSTPSSRAASPCPVSSAGAPLPCTTAAVDHVLASTQVPAATVTLAHTGSTGRQVAGSRMWCSSRPSRRHCRDRVLEVARAAPGGQADHGGGVVGLVPHEDPPAADRPGAGRGDVAAERDQHADPQLAGHHPGAPVGGPGLRGGTEVQRDVGRHRDDPVLRVDVDALPPRRGSSDDADAVSAPQRPPGSRGRSPARRARRRGWGRPPRR